MVWHLSDVAAAVRQHAMLRAVTNPYVHTDKDGNPRPYKNLYKKGMSAKKAKRLRNKHGAKGVMVLARGLGGLGEWRHLRESHPGLLTSTGMSAAMGGWRDSTRDALLKSVDRGLVADVDPDSVQGLIMRRGSNSERKVLAALEAITGWKCVRSAPGRSADFVLAHPTLLITASPDAVIDLEPNAAAYATGLKAMTEGADADERDEATTLDELPPRTHLPGDSALPASLRRLTTPFRSPKHTLRDYCVAREKFEVPWGSSGNALLEWDRDNLLMAELKCPVSRYEDPASTQIGHVAQMSTAMLLAAGAKRKKCVYVVTTTLCDAPPDQARRWARKNQVESNLTLLGLLRPMLALAYPARCRIAKGAKATSAQLAAIDTDMFTRREINNGFKAVMATHKGFGASAYHFDLYLFKPCPQAQLVLLDFAAAATPLIWKYRIAEDDHRSSLRDAATRAAQRASASARRARAAHIEAAVERKARLAREWTALCATHRARFMEAWNSGWGPEGEPAAAKRGMKDADGEDMQPPYMRKLREDEYVAL